MSRFWSQVARDLTPYVPGEQPKIANLIKLSAVAAGGRGDPRRTR